MDEEYIEGMIKNGAFKTMKEGIMDAHDFWEEQMLEIAEFISVGKVINCHDIGDATRVESLNDIAANESGCAGNDVGHDGTLVKISKNRRWAGHLGHLWLAMPASRWV